MLCWIMRCSHPVLSCGLMFDLQVQILLIFGAYFNETAEIAQINVNINKRCTLLNNKL